MPEHEDRHEMCGGALPNPAVQKHFFLLAYREFLDNPIGFILGFLAITSVVFVAALLGSILASAPVLFSALAEDEFGEIDLILSATRQSGYSFLNYTLIDEELTRPASSTWEDRSDAFQFTSPRIRWEGYVYNSKECGSCYGLDLDIQDNNWIYFGVPDVNQIPQGYFDLENEDLHQQESRKEKQRYDSPPQCYWPDHLAFFDCSAFYDSSDVNFNDLLPSEDVDDGAFCFETLCGQPSSAEVYAIDSEREKKIGLGRLWPYPSLEEGEVFLSQRFSTRLDIEIGDWVYLELDLPETFQGLWVEGMEGERFDSKWEAAFVPFKVKGFVDDSYGKFSSEEKRAVVLEYKYLYSWVLKYLHPNIPQSTMDQWNEANAYDYADQVVVNFPSPRHEVYTEQDADVTTRRGVEFATGVVYRLGAQDLSAFMPPIEALKIFRYMSMFFGLMLNIILFILMFLSVLLIYSLLSVSVERRTFSFGILRMVGLIKSDVLGMILLQPILNSIPAITVGLLLATWGTYSASTTFEELSGIPLQAGLTLEATILAVGAGLIIPLLASILPIQGALSKSLTDAIDTKRSKIAAVKVEISRAGGNKISKELFTFACALVMFGFLIYYLMPLALLSTNISLLLNIFFGLIIMMLLGLVLLSLNFQHLSERACVWGLFWWEKRGIPQVLIKSLVAHRGRNRFTSVMYALSIAFVIFIYVSYDINVTATLYQQQQQYGANYKIYSSSDGHSTITSRAELEELCDTNHLIQECTWVLGSAAQYTENLAYIQVSNLGRVFQYSSNVYGIAPNFFDASLKKFLVVEDMDSPDLDLVDQLYSHLGSSSMIIGGSYQGLLHLEVLDPFLIKRVASPSLTPNYHYTQPLAFLSACPDFYFSNFPLVSSQHSLVSFTHWLRLVDSDQYLSVDDLPTVELLIKPKSSLSPKEKKELVSTLQNVTSDFDLHLYVFSDSNEALEKADAAMTFFFAFTTVMAMAICFFSLTSSMYTNVHENAKETGILRAIGVPRDWIARIAIYEAFIIVFSSSLTGVVIGTAVAYTMSLQRVLFTEIPIPFSLPSTLLFVIFITSMGCAFLSTYRPIKELLEMDIVILLRLLF